LHREWDDVPARLDADHLGRSGVADARRVLVTPGPPSDWPAVWATETLRVSPEVFHGIAAGPEEATRHAWPIAEPDGYASTRARIQERQLVLAGARLAQVLAVALP
jgi:hypothetical protein